jgi:hypothetical protein
LFSLINTRATSCRTSPVGVGASVAPQWRRGVRPVAGEGGMQSASDTPSSHIRGGRWRSPSPCAAATSWRSRRPERDEPGLNHQSPGASPCGAGARARNHERHATRRADWSRSRRCLRVFAMRPLHKDAYVKLSISVLTCLSGRHGQRQLEVGNGFLVRQPSDFVMYHQCF